MTTEQKNDEVVLRWMADDGRLLSVWHVKVDEPKPQPRRPLHRRPVIHTVPPVEMAWRVADMAWAF